MGSRSTVIHINRHLAHQVAHGKALQRGFKAHGIRAEVSFHADTPGDVHVVSGPHFAYPRWRNANTLMIDRAYWGDPDCVAIHWLQDGEKVFLRGMPKRDHPRLKPLKAGDRTIYLCDYKERPERTYDTVRLHPAEEMPPESLEDALKAHQVAVGRRSTALVTAAIEGLRVETDDQHSPVYGIVSRKKWINDLAWHNWSMDEIASGAFLDGIGNNYSGD